MLHGPGRIIPKSGGKPFIPNPPLKFQVVRIIGVDLYILKNIAHDSIIPGVFDNVLRNPGYRNSGPSHLLSVKNLAGDGPDRSVVRDPGSVSLFLDFSFHSDQLWAVNASSQVKEAQTPVQVIPRGPAKFRNDFVIPASDIVRDFVKGSTSAVFWRQRTAVRVGLVPEINPRSPRKLVCPFSPGRFEHAFFMGHQRALLLLEMLFLLIPIQTPAAVLRATG